MNKQEVLFNLIRREICGAELSEEIKSNIDSDVLKELYDISKKFDITPIVASALSSNRLLAEDEASRQFNKELLLSVMRYEKMNYEFEAISKTLEAAKIPYIPLKGAVIRDLYPEKWMRLSCDIDILVKEEDLDRAVEALCEKLNYKTDRIKEYHNVSLFSESDIHLELHFNIKERNDSIDKLLADVWSFSKPEAEGAYKHVMTNEFMIFYNVAHMSYHFLLGGCGIRPFIDLYILITKLEYDKEKLSGLCKNCQIEKFRISVEETSRVWLENAEHTELTKKIQEYILSGGIYGDNETVIIMQKEKSGGNFKYMLQRVFQPYGILSGRYAILKKHRWLTPFYQVKRWFDVLAEGKAKKAANEFSVIVNADKEKNKKIMRLMQDVGLEP